MALNKFTGFTILELVVSIGIIVVLTAFFMPSLGGRSQRLVLDGARQQLLADLRGLEIKALSGALVSGSGGDRTVLDYTLTITDHGYILGYHDLNNAAVELLTQNWPTLNLTQSGCVLTFSLSSQTVGAANCEPAASDANSIVLELSDNFNQQKSWQLNLLSGQIN